jgi:hypothetical protein
MKKGALANPENAQKMKMQQKREVKLRQQKPSETIASGKEKNVLFESQASECCGGGSSEGGSQSNSTIHDNDNSRHNIKS